MIVALEYVIQNHTGDCERPEANVYDGKNDRYVLQRARVIAIEPRIILDARDIARISGWRARQCSQDFQADFKVGSVENPQHGMQHLFGQAGLLDFGSSSRRVFQAKPAQTNQTGDR